MKSKPFVTSFVSILSFSLFPLFFLFFRNLGTATIQDFLGLASIFVISIFIILSICWLLVRDIRKAALIAIIITGMLLYFAYIEKAINTVLPMLYYWHIALILLFFVIKISQLIYRKLPSITAGQLNQGVLLIFSGLILFNGVMAVPKLLSVSSKIAPSANDLNNERLNSLTEFVNIDHPNIYYFIFDEYGGFENINRYCNYDNTHFYESLEQIGFSASKNAVNETIDSYTEIPNLLQLQKINTVDMSAIEKKENLKSPYLIRLMKENGYVINALDSTNYDFIDASYADVRMTSDFVTTYGTFNSLIINNTALYPFFGKNDHDEEIKNMLNMFDYAMESSKKAESNLFTIGYFNFPHIPYIVDEDGNKTNASDRLNLQDPEPYLGQFIFASKKILEMVSEIVKNDPNSVIILQSDHGYRLPSHLHFWYGIDDYDLVLESPYERNILNAVYYKGNFIEIEGLSGLDTLKLVLNSLLGVDL